MSEHPLEEPPAADPIMEALDYPTPCTMEHNDEPCTRPAAWVGRAHCCSDKIAGAPALMCQDFLDRITGKRGEKFGPYEYPVRCEGCKHEFNSMLDFAWDLVPISDWNRGGITHES